LPFVVIPNERSEEESLFVRQFEQHHGNRHAFRGGRSFSFSSDITGGAERLPPAVPFPRAFLLYLPCLLNLICLPVSF
jgi:hypothetical protein